MHTPAPTLPTAETIRVDTRGAIILKEKSPQTKDSRGIYLPNYTEPVSHIAVDVGGSLAKVVYFTRSPNPPSPCMGDASSLEPPSLLQQEQIDGALTPMVLEAQASFGHLKDDFDDAALQRRLSRATLHNFPGGSLNFQKFETESIDDCIAFLQSLINQSAGINRVSVEDMRKSVQIMMTGGGAHLYCELFSSALSVEVRREDEMECLISGLNFLTLIPNEAYYFSDALVHRVSHFAGASIDKGLSPKSLVSNQDNEKLERPSPDPPKYAVTFEPHPKWQLPCLLVNIGSGVSIIKVDEGGKFERVSGTSLGGGTLWGLLSLLTPAKDFDGDETVHICGSAGIDDYTEMLSFSEKGDNATVDMLVGDIYGQDYSRLGLKSTTIASSFGKVFKKGIKSANYSPEDISKSLLYAISNNIGQIAYMNAEKYNIDRIYFSGYFIRGHAATIATLSYAIRFWSKGSKRALFLRHEGFLGAIGAWIKSIEFSGSEEVKERY